MDCNMKRFITIASICILALASCIGPHETDFDFSLDRDECRFAADSGQSYFRVFGEGRWTAAFEQEVDWVSLDKMEGVGESQILVFHKKNEGLSRGVNLFIDHEDGTRKPIYMSQKSGLGSDKPAYSLNTGNLKLLSLGMDIKVPAVSNISPEAVDSASVKTIYAGADSSWISGITITPEDVSLSVSPNQTGVERSAKIQFAFNGAVWDEPYTVFLNIVQGGAGPEISLAESYELDPYGSNSLTIKVETNWDPDLYSYDISDFSLSDDSFIRSTEFVDSTASIIIRPHWNKSASSRSTTLTWHAKDSLGNEVSKAETVLTQKVSDIQFTGDQSPITTGGKYANCYILPDHESQSYCFEPRLVDGSLPTGEFTNAGILWQTDQDILTCAVYSAEDGLVYIHKPEGAKGSAIVALMSEDGTITWSWHIWASGEAVGECTIGGYTFMDRNIGAIATTAPVDGECDAVGMFYQWGRKDPFPHASTFNVSGGMGVMADTYPSDAISLKVEQNGVSLETSIQNPSTFYWGNDNKGAEDWSSPQNDGYWNTDIKTDYDPCPYGYVVPNQNGIEALIKSKSSNASYGWALTCEDGGTTYLPCGGWFRRKLHATSQLAHVGQEPHYWSTASAAFNTSYKGSYATTYSTSSVSSNARRWGANIRCVKANNQ